jgi:hypothetical protein
LLLVAPALARAERVTLRNGVVFCGIAHREDGRVRIELEYGSITVDAAQVARIEARKSPLEEYRERAAALPEGDVAARERLAEWCRSQGLEKSAREQFEAILDIDPAHAGARRRLGYRRHGGEWLTEDDYRRAIGEVWYDGMWMTPAEVAVREDAKRRRAEEERKAREESERLAREAAERERAREREEAAERERYRYPTLVAVVHAPGFAHAGVGAMPWWCVPSWQNPNPPPCDARVQAAPPETDPKKMPWWTPPGPAWNTMGAGWGGRR